MTHLRWIKLAVFFLCLIPFGLLVYGIATQNLTANPIEHLLDETGTWALRILLVTLAMTPMRWLTGRTEFIRIRRMLGLFTFFYASLHLTIYTVLDLGLNFSHLTEDIIKRPFITVGFLAWLIMLPMAITSNNKMIRRLGKRWKTLHKSIYLVVGLACLHYIWLVKSDLTEPSIYAGIGLLLLLIRFFRFMHVRSKYKKETSQHPVTNQ